MKNKFILCILSVSLFMVSGCDKKDSTLPPKAETNVETEETEPLIYFTQGAQTNDEEIPWTYNIDPAEDTIDVEWVEWIKSETDFGLEVEQTFRVRTMDLLTFNQSDEVTEFSYLDEEDTEVKKEFEVLSNAIVQDENNKRYEWLSLMR